MTRAQEQAVCSQGRRREGGGLLSGPDEKNDSVESGQGPLQRPSQTHHKALAVSHQTYVLEVSSSEKLCEWYQLHWWGAVRCCLTNERTQVEPCDKWLFGVKNNP